MFNIQLIDMRIFVSIDSELFFVCLDTTMVVVWLLLKSMLRWGIKTNIDILLDMKKLATKHIIYILVLKMRIILDILLNPKNLKNSSNFNFYQSNIFYGP